MKNLLTHYAAGLCGKPLTLPTREPVAYLYNGVRLPKLPEWDKTVYPYAVIVWNKTLSKYFLDIHKDEPWVTAEGSYTAGDISYTVADDAWAVYGESNGGVSFNFSDTPVWANFNLRLYDSSAAELTDEVYLAASVPIPIYE